MLLIGDLALLHDLSSLLLVKNSRQKVIVVVINNGGGYYCRQTYLDECRRLGISLLLPDVNRSRVGVAWAYGDGALHRRAR